jgi:hypothetical protein
MKSNLNIKTFSLAAAFALSALAPIASYANADARAIDAVNESSEPPFLHSTADTTTQAKKATEQVTAQAKKATGEAESIAINSVNEGSSSVGK